MPIDRPPPPCLKPSVPLVRGMVDRVQALRHGCSPAVLDAWARLGQPGAGAPEPDQVRVLLDQGVPIDLLDAGQRTLLVAMLEHRPVPKALVSVLLKAGASFDVPTGNVPRQIPAWAVVARLSNPEDLRTLLERGLDPGSVVNPGAASPLGLLDLVILGPTGLGHRPKMGQPVPGTTQDRVIEAVNVLLDHGANGDGMPGARNSPLKRALTSNGALLRVAERLVERGANPGARQPFAVVHGLDSNGNPLQDLDEGSLLHHTAASGSLKAVRWLVERGHVDPLERSAQGATALQIARRRQSPAPEVEAYLERLILRHALGPSGLNPDRRNGRPAGDDSTCPAPVVPATAPRANRPRL